MRRPRSWTHLDVGPAAHERTRGARVIEVDVGEQDPPRRGVEGLQQRLMRGLRAGVDDDVVEREAADDERVAEVVDVDLTGWRHSGGPYNRPMDHRLPERDRPWMMRTYSGHSTAKQSNELYRLDFAKAVKAGVKVAFGTDADGLRPHHELARGEVGRSASPSPTGDMHALLDGIPLDT
jgi:hypothetical protein